MCIYIDAQYNDHKRQDLEKPAEGYDIHGTKKISKEVADTVAQWPKFAKTAGVDTKAAKTIRATHRLHIMADYFARVKKLEHISELIF